MKGDKRTLLERLEGKFEQRGEDECWPWTAACDKHGRGRITVNMTVRVAAQVILEANGSSRPAPPNDQALHKPDCLPSCSNFKHLRWGSQKDNMQDKILAGNSHRRGIIFNKSALTVQDIKDIRSSNFSNNDLAELYDVSVRTITDIRNKKSWVWVTD